MLPPFQTILLKEEGTILCTNSIRLRIQFSGWFSWPW